MNAILDSVARALGYAPVVELAERAQFEAELAAITTDAAARADLRQAAIIAGKAGATSADVEQALTAWNRYRFRPTYELKRVQRYIQQLIREAEGTDL